ncbi:hypothetical protein M2317_000862 [Microbacterium sp. ZKA21]|jgi:hypothetical protein|uniref:hypothetical protein n=1 Tax=Microbacterium sp. ZKA21 TaxID=3381694 RepID=UPI003D1C6D7A
MSQNDMLFLVLIVIGISSLTLVAVQLLKRPKRDDRGDWYEGPWDDDDRPRKR